MANHRNLEIRTINNGDMPVAQKLERLLFSVARRNHWMLGLCAVMAMMTASAAVADTIQFDPDGTAAANGTYTVSEFDFLPGNLLFKGLGSLEINKSNQPIEVYAQARLSKILDVNSLPIAVANLNDPNVANTNRFEITVIAHFSATANVNGTTTDFTLAASPTFKSFELRYDNIGGGGTHADDLAGTGFSDGTLVMGGNVAHDGADIITSGAFERGTGTTIFDQFGADNYGGLLTSKVDGGLQLSAPPTSINGDFIKTSLAQLQLALLNSSIHTPFQQANPSGQFLGYVPSRGDQNGLGADFQAQADANVSFTVVPEPSSLVLGLIALVAVVPVVRLRRSKAAA